MTTPKQLANILDALNVMENLNIYVITNDTSIFIADGNGKVISSSFTSAEEMVGWVSCYRDFKGGFHG